MLEELIERAAPKNELDAAENALKLVAEALGRFARFGDESDEALSRAEELSGLERFKVGASHRPLLGPVIRALKRGLIEVPAPLHLEFIRPQAVFNREAVRLARLLQGESSHDEDDPAALVRRRLEVRVDSTQWKVASHRGGLPGRLVERTKTGYLESLAPLLRRVLAPQVEFNGQAASVLEKIATGASPAKLAPELTRLEELGHWPARLELPSVLRLTIPIWKEVFRRQEAFNDAFVAALRALVGLSLTRDGYGVVYEAWIAERERVRDRELADQIAAYDGPLFSVLVPVHETPPAVLRQCFDSVLGQRYRRWELCVVDDGSAGPETNNVLAEYETKLRPDRFRLERLSARSGISAATNRAFHLARGEMVCFLDHDDVLASTALLEVAVALTKHPDADLLYSDEDKLSPEGKRTDPFFKPDWSPDLLRSCNYINHFLVARRTLLAAMDGPLRSGLEGAQDYDLVLRASEHARAIVHIPQVLYHWRQSPSSTASDVYQKPEATASGVRALQGHLDRTSPGAVASAAAATNYRVSYPLPATRPLVSLIVPFRDRADLLRQLTQSLQATAYGPYELLLISNNSSRPETFALLDELRSDARVRILEWNHPFNWSAINNFGARHASGEVLVFLNNDIEIIEPQWLEELVSNAVRPEIGLVGSRLLYPDRSIQHAGVVVGINGFAGHAFVRLDSETSTAFGRATWYRNYLALTGACLAVRRALFEEIGGLDESFEVCGSDVELGLRVVKSGKRVLYNPFSCLVHHESATRDPRQIPDVDFWRSYEAYGPWLRSGDPFYNPNLSLSVADGRLRKDPGTGEEMTAGALAQIQLASSAREEHLKRRRETMGYADHLDLPRVPRGTRTREKPRHPIRRATWFIPYFRHAFGGVHTILRFGHLLKEHHQFENYFVVYDNPAATKPEIERRVATLYDDLPGEFGVLHSLSELSNLPSTDLVVATLWTSAYFAAAHPSSAPRAYFVQDYEPMFYPAGTMFALAEQTYRMGFFGVFNTPGLGRFVRSEYGMSGVDFEPAVDQSVFHDRRPLANRVPRIFFYGRPSVDRNGFELGAIALKRLKARLGGKVEIVSAGEVWRPADYGLEGVVTNHGVLPYEKTGDLYRTCDVGLCFMFTKHPSYLPLEMMACGVTVVTNRNPANTWLLKEGENCLLADPVCSDVLAQLERAVQSPSLRERIGAVAAKRMRQGDWAREVARVHSALQALATGEIRNGDPTARTLEVSTGTP